MSWLVAPRCTNGASARRHGRAEVVDERHHRVTRDSRARAAIESTSKPPVAQATAIASAASGGTRPTFAPARASAASISSIAASHAASEVVDAIAGAWSERSDRQAQTSKNTVSSAPCRWMSKR